MTRQRLWVGTMALSVLLGFAVATMAEEDHLKGYKIKDLNQVLPPTNPHTLTDQFGSESCELKKPAFFLVASEKDAGDDPRGGAAGEFVCYKAKCTGSQPPVTDVESQFGLHSLETKKTKLVCLPIPAPCPGSGGIRVGGFCWYIGFSSQSCDTVCAGHGLTCDPATVTYAGSSGTDAACEAIVAAFGGGTLELPSAACGIDGVGCHGSPGSEGRCASPPTTCSAAAAFITRYCACQ